MGLDDLGDGESRTTRPGGTETPPTRPRVADGEPTITLTPRDRAELEAGLLPALLALGGGLVAPGALAFALGAWGREPALSLVEVLIGGGMLDESDAPTVAALAARHLARHGGDAHAALAALGEAARFRLDPGAIDDPDLRHVLAGLVAGPADGPRPGVGGPGPRFEILRHHARGGLGVVSVARDRELRREVALKEIREDCVDHPDSRARFLREAEVTGRLEHPGIVPVYGMGEHPDGRPYYIMRFIRGETLKAAIVRLHKAGPDGEEVGTGGGPDLHALVGRFVDACHAVAYAHHRKILHRDLKPVNIMLGPFGETLVVDWGLAKSFDGSRSGEFPLPGGEEGTLRPESGSELTPTRVGSQVGTRGYMSPEQAAGRLDELGPASDIYGLGASLYYLAAGRPPFDGAGKEECLRRVREGDFPAPTRVNPAVPRALGAICLKAMALRPTDRYQDVGELINDLERWRAGAPVLAYPEPPLDRLARRARRHKAPLAAAAALLACVTIGLAAYAARERDTNVKLATAGATVRRTLAASEANRAMLLRALKSILREVNGADLAFQARSEDLRARMANDLVAAYRDLLARSPDDKRVRFDLAQACQLAANIGRSMGKLDPARALYDEAIRLLESLGNWKDGRDDPRRELAILHNNAGENDRMAGRPRGAVAEDCKGLEALRRAVAPSGRGPDDRRVEARLQLDLAAALTDLGRIEEAEPACRRSIELLGPQMPGEAVDRTGQVLRVYAAINLAGLHRLGGRFAEASAEVGDAARRAASLVAEVSDPDTRFALAAARNEQGALLLEADPDGPAVAALGAFREAYSLLEPLYLALPRTIEFQRSFAATLNGRGSCYLRMKRLEEARADFSEARRILDRLDAAIPNHFQHLEQLGCTLANLARTARAQAHPDARGLFLKAIECLGAAHEQNPNAPDLIKLLGEARRDLAELGEGTAAPPARP